MDRTSRTGCGPSATFEKRRVPRRPDRTPFTRRRPARVQCANAMPRSLLPLAVLVGLVGCNVPPAYQQPPVDSYRRTTVRASIGSAMSTVQAAQVSPDFFDLAGARPLVGRFFVKGDVDAGRFMVLSYDFWSERMAASPSVIGSKVDLDGQPTVVVGVAPRNFRVPEGAQLWTLQ